MRTVTATVLVLAMTGLLGCGQSRDLKITEVGYRAVEIALSEPPDHAMGLNDIELRWKRAYIDATTNQPMEESGAVELHGRIRGLRHLVIWEKPGHTGPPRSEDYTNSRNETSDGIAVAEGFFGTQDDTSAYAYRVVGYNTRVVALLFPVRDSVDDVVKFGPHDPGNASVPVRPDIGGRFTSDGSLAGEVREAPANAAHIYFSRKVSDGDAADPNDDRYRDADDEGDWKVRIDSMGRLN